MSWRSMRRQLLLYVLGAVLLVWAVSAVVSYLDAHDELDELLDAHLEQAANLLIVQVGHELVEDEQLDVETFDPASRYLHSVSFQVWHDGKLRLRSSSSPVTLLSERLNGFSDVTHDGKLWRVYSAHNKRHDYIVQVAEMHSIRDSISDRIVINFLAPLLIALPALGLVVWFAIGRGTRPLTLLAREVRQRDPTNLSALQLPTPPDEVAPLVQSLNRLFERVRHSIEHEHRFTADAAHELRTPIAALRAQAEVARGAHDDAERRHALDGVIEGCERATRLVSQMLTLARLEPEGYALERESVELRRRVRAVLADAVDLAVRREVTLEFIEGEPLQLKVNAELLDILLRNLVDNALRYSPPHTTVRVSLKREASWVLVRVTDEGPGVPVELRAQLGQRFHRLEPGSAQSGSGLGLSIAQRIAQLHGASLRFDDNPAGRGLQVTLQLPA